MRANDDVDKALFNVLHRLFDFAGASKARQNFYPHAKALHAVANGFIVLKLKNGYFKVALQKFGTIEDGFSDP